MWIFFINKEIISLEMKICIKYFKTAEFIFINLNVVIFIFLYGDFKIKKYMYNRARFFIHWLLKVNKNVSSVSEFFSL